MEIPILSNMVEGLGVFFKTKRYVAYLIVFVAATFMSIFFSIVIANAVGTSFEVILTTAFVYVGATGAIYFGLGALFTGVGLDNLWITRRGRGHVTELKGAVWMALSFAISVFLGVFIGRYALYIFAVFGWVGWIAFQAYLSSRTSLRLASIVEPKKGGIAIGIGSFIILIVGLGIIAAEALLALVLVPNNMFDLATIIVGIFPDAVVNITTQYQLLLVAYAMMGLFALVSLVSFFKYARRGAALNISLLVLFIALYAGYFLVNVMRRTGAPQIEATDILMTLFFLAYAMSGIGTTITGAVEGSRSRLRDFGPLLTFFLASSFFFVDSIISLSTVPNLTTIPAWFGTWVGNESGQLATWVFRDIAKLIAFPLAATVSMLYYLRTERVERIVTRAREEGETLEADKVDKDIAEAMPGPGESWPSERAEGIKEGKQGHELSAPDSHRLSVGSDRRLGKVKRLGEEDEDEED